MLAVRGLLLRLLQASDGSVVTAAAHKGMLYVLEPGENEVEGVQWSGESFRLKYVSFSGIHSQDQFSSSLGLLAEDGHIPGPHEHVHILGGQHHQSVGPVERLGSH